MKKLNLILSCIIIGIVVISVFAILKLNQSTHQGDVIATITVDGKPYDTINLSQVDTEKTFTIDNHRGGTNTVTIRPGEIGIIHANCHDQICVNRGFISDSLVPTVCLPNGVVITLESYGDVNDSLDIIAE